MNAVGAYFSARVDDARINAHLYEIAFLMIVGFFDRNTAGVSRSAWMPSRGSFSVGAIHQQRTRTPTRAHTVKHQPRLVLRFRLHNRRHASLGEALSLPGDMLIRYSAEETRRFARGTRHAPAELKNTGGAPRQSGQKLFEPRPEAISIFPAAIHSSQLVRAFGPPLAKKKRVALRPIMRAIFFASSFAANEIAGTGRAGASEANMGDHAGTQSEVVANASRLRVLPPSITEPVLADRVSIGNPRLPAFVGSE